MSIRRALFGYTVQCIGDCEIWQPYNNCLSNPFDMVLQPVQPQGTFVYGANGRSDNVVTFEVLFCAEMPWRVGFFPTPPAKRTKHETS